MMPSFRGKPTKCNKTTFKLAVLVENKFKELQTS